VKKIIKADESRKIKKSHAGLDPAFRSKKTKRKIRTGGRN
jgi:hypothetical protein